jgi:hypothetical protein
LISERAERCRDALTGYANDGLFTNLVDFLTDAMHWCDESGEDFHYALCVACKHYLAEVNEEPIHQPTIERN